MMSLDTPSHSAEKLSLIELLIEADSALGDLCRIL